jgi:hypothetical protein
MILSVRSTASIPSLEPELPLTRGMPVSELSTRCPPK